MGVMGLSLGFLTYYLIVRKSTTLQIKIIGRHMSLNVTLFVAVLVSVLQDPFATSKLLSEELNHTKFGVIKISN